MQVYIWGTGDIATRYLKTNELKEDEIIGFIETKRSKEMFENKVVYEPQEIIGTQYDYIIVCVNIYGKEIYDCCKENGIDTERVIFVDNGELREPTYHLNEILEVDKLFPQLYQSCIKENDVRWHRYITVLRNGFDLVEKDALISSKEFSGQNYQTDYFRYRTFELLANEILKKQIEGDVAEVGVFQGTFSKLINAKFKEKTLYLFDTFESFDKNEFESELAKGRCPEGMYESFKGTSEDKVIQIMPYPEKCIVRKGLFPETAKGLENVKYAFVSIDVDFEKSILEGLRYFYPRLEQGGALFVHDYNNRFLEGVKKAVDTYEKELGEYLKILPLADEGGTLVILK